MRRILSFCLVNGLGKHNISSFHYERLRNTESFCPTGVSIYTLTSFIVVFPRHMIAFEISIVFMIAFSL